MAYIILSTQMTEMKIWTQTDVMCSADLIPSLFNILMYSFPASNSSHLMSSSDH